MTENISLLTYTYPYGDSGGNPLAYSMQRIIGIELADGQRIESWFVPVGEHRFRTVDLQWPQEKAERLAAFFDEHLTTMPYKGRPWNCHSMVAAVMGWEVYWDKNGYPYNMPVQNEVSPDQLENAAPYGFMHRTGGTLQHSAMGTPDPSRSISILGSRREMAIAPNEWLQEGYGAHILKHSLRPVSGPWGVWRAKMTGYRSTEIPYKKIQAPVPGTKPHPTQPMY